MRVKSFPPHTHTHTRTHTQTHAGRRLLGLQRQAVSPSNLPVCGGGSGGWVSNPPPKKPSPLLLASPPPPPRSVGLCLRLQRLRRLQRQAVSPSDLRVCVCVCGGENNFTQRIHARRGVTSFPPPWKNPTLRVTFTFRVFVVVNVVVRGKCLLYIVLSFAEVLRSQTWGPRRRGALIQRVEARLTPVLPLDTLTALEMRTRRLTHPPLLLLDQVCPATSRRVRFKDPRTGTEPSRTEPNRISPPLQQARSTASST